MRSNKLEVIKCPKCNREYLPCEIYLPNEFLGRVTDIDRDYTTGSIESYSGKSMNTEERYVCDSCNTAFKVSAKVQFVTQVDVERDFSNDYSTKLKKQKLFMSED